MIVKYDKPELHYDAVDEGLDELDKLIILKMAAEQKIASSYQFGMVYRRIGSIASPVRLLDELERDGLVRHEGVFEGGDPSFYRNVVTTAEGVEFLNRAVEHVSVSTEGLTEQGIAVLKWLGIDSR